MSNARRYIFGEFLNVKKLFSTVTTRWRVPKRGGYGEFLNVKETSKYFW